MDLIRVLNAAKVFDDDNVGGIESESMWGVINAPVTDYEDMCVKIRKEHMLIIY